MIREARHNDIKSMGTIISTVWQDAYKGVIEENTLKERTIERMIKNVNNAFHERDFFVFEENNIIKGIISGKNIDNINCEIGQLYVCVEFQGMNIGTRLLEYMKKYYKTHGCKNMIIWTIKNLRNNEFYRKNNCTGIEEKEIEIGGFKYPGIGFKYIL
jgi:N-acetylglutamate synthase-like GNAT family acetyltransferase